MITSLCCILLISPFLGTFVTSHKTVVHTASGRVKGRVVSHNGILVREFLGIPYVKSPLGELRFKRPVPIERWNGTLVAKSLRPGCPQVNPYPFPWVEDPPVLSEDCLYLNVWAPVTADRLSKKSVMFWIHGGGFRISTSRVDFYQGQVLAAEGDVIVVTTDYRLGALGFFYSKTEDAPGNVGMLDLVEALKWVKRNIELFGGDKHSITIFGWSAGGISTGMLCVSPVSRGLFQRAILQSAAPTNVDVRDRDHMFKVSQKVAEAAGCSDMEKTLKDDPETVVKCMRGIAASELVVKISKVTIHSERLYYPMFGDELLPVDPRIAISNGDFHPRDILIGSTNGDGAYRITSFKKDVFGVYGEKNPQINLTFGESILRDLFKNYPDPGAVVRHYLKGVHKHDYEEIRCKVFTAAGDHSITCPTVYFAESFAKKCDRVYYYFFRHRPSVTPFAPWMLAVHHDETPFVFGYPLRYPQKYSLEEQKLSRRMILAWSNFAKIGCPEPGWPLYSKSNTTYQILDTDKRGRGCKHHLSDCNFFRTNFGF